jgi:hypothetical protein
VATPVAPGSLTTWLAGPGYTAIQTTQATLSALQAPNVPAATVQQLSRSLCSDVIGSEASPPPVDLADYTTAMNDFAKGSAILRPGTAAAQTAAGPYISAGTAALSAFREAIGRPS